MTYFLEDIERIFNLNTRPTEYYKYMFRSVLCTAYVQDNDKKKI